MMAEGEFPKDTDLPDFGEAELSYTHHEKGIPALPLRCDDGFSAESPKSGRTPEVPARSHQRCQSTFPSFPAACFCRHSWS